MRGGRDERGEGGRRRGGREDGGREEKGREEYHAPLSGTGVIIKVSDSLQLSTVQVVVS